MKVAGLIAEFNPLHLGHKYLLEQIKKETKADAIITVLSGDYVQRGEPACMDKYARTRMALLAGADMVLELPVYAATSSAEGFAKGAISILAATGLVDSLCFGSKYPDFPYMKVAQILLDEPEPYKTCLKDGLKNGLSFPTARQEALLSYTNSLGLCFPSDALSEANTILGIEYAKAILSMNLSMEIHPLKRMGNGYNDTSLEGEFLSATAIRLQMEKNTDSLYGLPSFASEMILSYKEEKKSLFPDSLSDILYLSLLQNQDGYQAYLDCDSDLSCRIKKQLADYQSFTQFAGLLKSKNYTYSRICRVLLHIALGIKERPFVPYLRPLGFTSNAAPLLSKMKETASLPLLSKMANAKEILSPYAYEFLLEEVHACQIYEQLAFSGGKKLSEWQQSPIRQELALQSQL